MQLGNVDARVGSVGQYLKHHSSIPIQLHKPTDIGRKKLEWHIVVHHALMTKGCGKFSLPLHVVLDT